MKKVITLISAITLSFAIVIQAVPITYAINPDEPAVEEDNEDTAVKTAAIMCEEESEQDEFSRVFRLSDGSYLAASYSQQVNYKRGDKYERIDNTLTFSKEDDIGYYTNKSNRIYLSFPSVLKNDRFVTYSNGEYSVSFSMEDVKQSVAVPSKATDNTKRITELREKVFGGDCPEEEYENAVSELNKLVMTNTGNVSFVTYKSVKENVDLIYVITGSALKENIVLNETPRSPAEFSFIVKAPDMSASLLEDGSVVFESETETFTMSSPFMTDSKENTCGDIDVSLEDLENGTYRYTLKPDVEWLTDKSIEYPVTIDPPVMDSNTDTVKDTTAVFGDSVGNLGSSGEMCYLKVGRRYDSELEANTEVQSMIYSPVPSAVKSDKQVKIVNVVLALAGYAGGFSSCASGIQINAYMINRDWNT